MLQFPKFILLSVSDLAICLLKEYVFQIWYFSLISTNWSTKTLHNSISLCKNFGQIMNKTDNLLCKHFLEHSSCMYYKIHFIKSF